MRVGKVVEVIVMMMIVIAMVVQPAEFVRTNFSAEKGEDFNQEIKFAKGTTTLAFKFDGGIIVAVDSRATQGPYIGKLVPVWLVLDEPWVFSRLRACALFSERNCEEGY